MSFPELGASGQAEDTAATFLREFWHDDLQPQRSLKNGEGNESGLS